jgi:hypothetical protein
MKLNPDKKSPDTTLSWLPGERNHNGGTSDNVAVFTGEIFWSQGPFQWLLAFRY